MKTEETWVTRLKLSGFLLKIKQYQHMSSNANYKTENYYNQIQERQQVTESFH